jgi:cysteinyl-tRNA synthetase
MIKLYNSLTRKVEDFTPLDLSLIRMYNCGPTVYDFIHIGNLRAFFTADLVRRSLEWSGYEVKQVMNVTDVGIGGDNDEGEDKIVKGLKREGKSISLESMKELTDFYTERFREDIAKLNIKTPHVMPRASEHITEDIELIHTLEEKGFAYTTSDGVYFDTSRDPHYGKLGGLTSESVESRIEENLEKRSSRDFALWKFNSNLGYPSPWGQGFPGWHIECSAMATKYLGPSFDIHTGGIDLASIHHNNEIAQSENACGCQLARYWVHNGFLNLQGEKMAKSEGNVFTIKSLAEKGFSPLAYRYFLLQSHYRSPVNFTFEALGAAENAYRKLKEFFATLPYDSKELSPSIQGNALDKFREAIENDLNTPEALAAVWATVKDDSLDPALKRRILLEYDKVLGLDIENNEYEVKVVPKEIEILLKEREEARKLENWTKSDELREKIKSMGYEVRDEGGTQNLKKI